MQLRATSPSRLAQLTVLVPLSALWFPIGAHGQATRTVHGLVADQESGKPVPSALVRVLGTNLTTETSDRGRFVFTGVPAGRQLLIVERIGYEARRSEIEIPAGQDIEIVVRISTKPVALEPIDVTVRSGRLTEVGFFDRRDTGGLSGRYITHADILHRNATVLTDVLADVQGVKVIHIQPGRDVVRFNRHVPTEDLPGQKPRYALDPPRNALELRGCEPDLYINGRLYRNSSPPMQTGGQAGWQEPVNKVNDFNAIPVNEIEGVEVYVGAAIPPFVRNTACGVVLLWTRR